MVILIREFWRNFLPQYHCVVGDRCKNSVGPATWIGGRLLSPRVFTLLYSLFNARDDSLLLWRKTKSTWSSRRGGEWRHRDTNEHPGDAGDSDSSVSRRPSRLNACLSAVAVKPSYQPASPGSVRCSISPSSAASRRDGASMIPSARTTHVA